MNLTTEFIRDVGAKLAMRSVCKSLNLEQYEDVPVEVDIMTYGNSQAEEDIKNNVSTEIPSFLSDHYPSLVVYWVDGYNSYCEYHETLNCSYCQDENIELCPFHDY